MPFVAIIFIVIAGVAFLGFLAFLLCCGGTVCIAGVFAAVCASCFIPASSTAKGAPSQTIEIHQHNHYEQPKQDNEVDMSVASKSQMQQASEQYQLVTEAEATAIDQNDVLEEPYHRRTEKPKAAYQPVTSEDQQGQQDRGLNEPYGKPSGVPRNLYQYSASQDRSPSAPSTRGQIEELPRLPSAINATKYPTSVPPRFSDAEQVQVPRNLYQQSASQDQSLSAPSTRGQNGELSRLPSAIDAASYPPSVPPRFSDAEQVQVPRNLYQQSASQDRSPSAPSTRGQIGELPRLPSAINAANYPASVPPRYSNSEERNI